MFNLFSDFKKTRFKAGYLKKDNIPLSSSEINNVDPKFRAPRKIDNRDMCLLSDNQGDNPYCAGYATAGYVEFQNWKTLHYPIQVNAIDIYKKAKELEQNNDDGTTFSFTVQAVKNLGIYNAKYKYVKPTIQDVQFAIHQYGVCMAGFMITDEWNYVSVKSGQISKNQSAQKLGGHAVLLCGYDYDGVYIQNSWGDKWGIHGFAILSWDQFVNQFMNGVVMEL